MALPFIDIGQLRLSQKLNDVNDSVAGGNAAGGTGGALYQGLLGKRVWLDNDAALQLSDTTIGTLYGGIYQYVQFLTGSSASNARGQIVFWSIGASSATAVLTGGSQYVVTPDGSATVGDGLWAGISLSVVSKGNYGWIQIAGLASIKFRGTVTNKTAGNLVTVTTTSNVADGDIDSGAILAGGTLGAKNILGVALEAPGDGAISKVFLKNPILF